MLTGESIDEAQKQHNTHPSSHTRRFRLESVCVGVLDLNVAGDNSSAICSFLLLLSPNPSTEDEEVNNGRVGQKCLR